MRTVQASEITKNIREMCIEANHFLSDDMKKVFNESVEKEESPLGKQILNQLQENLEIAGRDMIPICQDTGMAVVFIKVGQEVTCILPKADRPYTAAVITLSDKGAAGEREDKSGPAIVEMLKSAGYDIKETLLLADEQLLLEKELMRLSDQRQVNVIFTTGGTGFSERDRTPEATIAVCDRMANGIAEAIRNYSMTITPRAMFSRAVSGIRKRTLIINLPGSPKAVKESLEFLLPNLEHGLGILRGSEGECARM